MRLVGDQLTFAAAHNAVALPIAEASAARSVAANTNAGIAVVVARGAEITGSPPVQVDSADRRSH